MTDFLILPIFLFYDTIMIQTFSLKMWQENVKKVSKQPLQINYLYALLSYICISIGIYLISKKYEENYLGYGILLGLAIYGTYNFTNLGIFKDYDIRTGLLDTVLGTISIILTLYTVKLIKNYYKNK